MDETIINIIGYIGSFFISLNLIPQIFTIIKKRSGKNISYFSVGINIIASILMLTYSTHKKLYPIMISNVVIFITSNKLNLFTQIYIYPNPNLKLKVIY